MNHDIDTTGIMPAVGAEPVHEMMSVTEEEGSTTKVVRINFSSLAILQKCLREAEYSLVRKLRPKLEVPALVFGSAIHKGLETYYCGERTERSIPPDYRATMGMIGCGQWDDKWSESLLFRAARAFVLKAEPLRALPDDNKRSIFTGVWMLQWYFEKYLTDEYVIMRDDAGLPYVERKVSMPLAEYWCKDLLAQVKIELFGTIDAILRSEVTGQILIADHKTASSLYGFYDKINPNFQYTGYVLAAREALGIDTNTFLVNALQVKSPPKTARGSEPEFARQVTERSEEDFTELRKAVEHAVRGFLLASEAKYFPMSASGACTAFYGACRYIQICGAPAQLRENIISANFQETP